MQLQVILSQSYGVETISLKQQMYTFIQQHVKRESPFLPVPKLYFGISNQYEVSVQAGSGLYSIPRKDGVDHTGVEIGFPNFNFSPEFIKEYAQDPESPQDTIYGFVPIDRLVNELIRISSQEVE